MLKLPCLGKTEQYQPPPKGGYTQLKHLEHTLQHSKHLVSVVKVTQCVRILATPCKVPLSMGFSRQAYWSGLPFPSPQDLPDPGIKPMSPALQAGSLLTELGGKP